MRILSVLAMMFLFIACEEIHLQDGFSVVTKVDPVYSTDNVLSGYTTSYYKDTDWSGDYTEGDEFQNSFTIFNGTNGQPGLNASISMTLLPPSDECLRGSVFIESYTGTILTGRLSLCLPENGYSPVMSVREIKDQDGKVIGNETSFYLDLDRDKKVSEGDEYMGGVVVWNGISSTVTLEIVEGYLVITSTINGEIGSSVTIELPKNGLTPSIETILYNNPCGCGGAAGTMYIWYFDINKNGSRDENEEAVSKAIICNGKDGNSAQLFIPLTLAWDFAGQSSNAVYIANGWKFNGSGVSDGNIYMEGAGKLTTPLFRDNVDLLSLTFHYGSSTSRDVKVIAIMSDYSERIIDEFHSDAISGFKVNDYSQYKMYQYYADLDDIEFKNIKSIRIEASNKLKCTAPDFLIREIIVDLNDKNVQ